MDKNIKIHWPSFFWFSVAIVAVIVFFNEQKASLLLQAISLSCLGYSSIRLVPGDLFARKLSFSTLIETKTKYRRSDILYSVSWHCFAVHKLSFWLCRQHITNASTNSPFGCSTRNKLLACVAGVICLGGNIGRKEESTFSPCLLP